MPTDEVDLNADVGEGFGQDPALMAIVSSASIACGLHAGDASLMRETVALAKHHGVAIGAHPSFADRAGFGRREMSLPAREVESLIAYQVGALAAIAAAEGVRLQHVKPHGALYNMAAKDRAMADAIAAAIAQVDPTLVMVGLPASALEHAAARAGLPFAAEGFADRAYAPDGSLVARSQPGALITDPAAAADGALALARGGRVRTICIHSDTPGAAAIGAAVRRALDGAGLRVAGLDHAC
jgi:UPF0271 protein